MVVSWISFVVPPDVIPGRMALLITLFLVLTNIFNVITKLVGVAESNEFGGSALAYMAVDPALDGVTARVRLDRPGSSAFDVEAGSELESERDRLRREAAEEEERLRVLREERERQAEEEHDALAHTYTPREVPWEVPWP